MELDISKLVEGQIFDTYPELCKTLGSKVYGGYQKTKQLKDFFRYFDYEKNGKQFIIKEIYKEPMSEEYRVAANAKYVTFVQNILLSYLSQQKEEIIYLSRQKLWSILGMVNNKYFIMREQHRREELMNLSEDMSMFDINHFFTRSSLKFCDIVETSLNSLKRRKLLIYEKVYRIGEIVTDCDSFRSDIVYRDATDTEKKYILKNERKVLKEFGFQNETQMLMSNKKMAYYERLDKIFKAEKDWVHVYSCYKFIYDKSNVIEAINEDVEIQQINQLVIDSLNEQAENNYKKKGFTSDTAAIRIFDEEKPFFYHKGYQKRQMILTDNLIRRSKR